VEEKGILLHKSCYYYEADRSLRHTVNRMLISKDNEVVVKFRQVIFGEKKKKKLP